MNRTEARTLHGVLNGAGDRQLSDNASQVALGRLRNAGYLTRDTDPAPTDDLQAALAAIDPGTLGL